jgi:hypothetical protein
MILKNRGASLLLCISFVFGPVSFAQDTQSAVDEHHPVVSAKINGLAHRLLETALKTNALTGDDLKPFHLKIDFQVIEPRIPKPVSGSLEEWYVGPHQWRRAYQGGTPDLNGTEWSVSRFEHYQTKPGESGFSYYALNLRVARPVVNPMYQATNIHPDYDLTVSRINTAGVALNCISVPDAKRYAADTNPDWLFATMCFDADTRLRLTVAGDTSVQFDDLQPFQGRAVARDVKVIQRGNLIAAMKITLLEPLENATPELVRPAKNAVAQPYIIEPGFPAPEPVYQVGAHVPLGNDGMPLRGSVSIPILIRRDGSVKVRQDEIAPIYSGPLTPNARYSQMYSKFQGLKDALVVAVGQWKYKPNIVDGQLVEVGLTVVYVLDGKPFVPAYERPKPADSHTPPDDFASVYDPKRDPQKDLELAETAAARAHKRILMEVGGDWCIWCKRLDQFFTQNTDLRAARDASFVTLKVNMSPQNENYAFLHRFPEILGYPFIFVLDANGKLLGTENTNDLENGSTGYDPGRVKKFLSTWQPKQE